jgi:hypothetical protein
MNAFGATDALATWATLECDQEMERDVEADRYVAKTFRLPASLRS